MKTVGKKKRNISFYHFATELHPIENIFISQLKFSAFRMEMSMDHEYE